MERIFRDSMGCDGIEPDQQKPNCRLNPFPSIKFDAMVIDHHCQQLEPQHQQFDLLQTVTIKCSGAELVSFNN